MTLYFKALSLSVAISNFKKNNRPYSYALLSLKFMNSKKVCSRSLLWWDHWCHWEGSMLAVLLPVSFVLLFPRLLLLQWPWQHTEEGHQEAPWWVGFWKKEKLAGNLLVLEVRFLKLWIFANSVENNTVFKNTVKLPSDWKLSEKQIS